MTTDQKVTVSMLKEMASDEGLSFDSMMDDGLVVFEMMDDDTYRSGEISSAGIVSWN